MTTRPMTCLERLLTTLGHQEPDRVPLLLSLTIQGARELGLTIEDYYARPENVAEAQIRMWKKWGGDILGNFFYASIETEAWGGETIFYDDGPPNAGAPIIKQLEDIMSLEAPRVADAPGLQRVLRATALMREKAGPDVPILGVAVSPFSLPVMQLGFGKYLDLLSERPDLLEHLMRVNEEFCVEWSNAQLEAGATVIGYFDPVSSPTIVPRDFYLGTGLEVARRTMARIAGPTATLLASGISIPIIDDVATTGTAIVSASCKEDLAEVKRRCAGRLTVVGNLNGIEMRRWSASEAEAEVKSAIAAAGPGGGFILCDSHGEIPWQVSDEVLGAISEAVRTWGRYPLDWVDETAAV
jgi:uroporphyrinogen decarboxylase